MSKENWLLGLVLLASLGCATQKHEAGDSTNPSAKSADFNYAELQTKALDEMQAVVNKQIKKADQFVKDEDEEEAAKALQSALRYVLSRPNGDNMVSQLIPPLRSKLRELEAFDTALAGIVDTAIHKITDKTQKAGVRATQYFVLENFLSEFKPETAMNEDIKKLFMKIRDAKIEISGAIANDLKMRAMYGSPKSPSALAAQIIGPAKP